MLPTLWFRNTWSWGAPTKAAAEAVADRAAAPARIAREHATLGAFGLRLSTPTGGAELALHRERDQLARLFGAPNAAPYVKDAFHEYVVARPKRRGESRRDRDQGGGALRARRARRAARSSAAATAAGTQRARRRSAGVRRRLRGRSARPTSSTHAIIPRALDRDERARRAPGARGHAVVEAVLPLRRRALAGRRPGQPPPPPERGSGRNRDWTHLYNARRHLDAGQVGVPVVRGVGPGVSLVPLA